MPKVIIIGTSHISPKAVSAVRERIISVRPDCVAVELCPTRYRGLHAGPGRPSLRAGVTVWLLHWLQQRLGQATGVLPGSEMLEAISAGRAVGARVVLIDTTIEDIVAGLKAVSLHRKVALVLRLMAGFVAAPKLVDLSEVPEEKFVKDVLRYMRKVMPDFYRILVTDRNAYMAGWIKKLAKEYKKIIVVVGLGHKAGLESILGRAGLL